MKILKLSQNRGALASAANYGLINNVKILLDAGALPNSDSVSKFNSTSTKLIYVKIRNLHYIMLQEISKIQN